MLLFSKNSSPKPNTCLTPHTCHRVCWCHKSISFSTGISQFQHITNSNSLKYFRGRFCDIRKWEKYLGKVWKLNKFLNNTYKDAHWNFYQKYLFYILLDAWSAFGVQFFPMIIIPYYYVTIILKSYLRYVLFQFWIKCNVYFFKHIIIRIRISAAFCKRNYYNG